MPPAPGHDLGLSTAPPPSQLTPHPLFLPCPLISLTARPNLRLLLLAAAVASMAPPPPGSDTRRRRLCRRLPSVPPCASDVGLGANPGATARRARRTPRLRLA